MDFVTRRATAYRDLVLIGVRCGELRRSTSSADRWTVQCKHEAWCDKEQAKQAVAGYLRHEFDAVLITFSRAIGSKPGDFVAHFTSDAI